MAKRFTDTEKWKNPWYRKMPIACRELWNYILDMCDPAGIWRVDLETAQHFIGVQVSEDDILAHFSERIIGIDSDKWFIPSFVEFQYGILKKESKPHQSAINILTKHGIDPVTLTLSSCPQYPLFNSPKGIHTLKDKDKDKAKAKDQDKDQDCENIFISSEYETPEIRAAYIQSLIKEVGA